MGFMDKAKKIAEQAQQKLDEAQKNFNTSASPQAGGGQDAVRYDEHGRPIQEGPPDAAAPPAGTAPPPPVDPATPPAAPDPGAAAPASEPTADEPPPPAQEGGGPAQEGGGQANSSPDPFKPLQQ